jgi:hypothetical protein
MIADKGYDADWRRADLLETGITLIIHVTRTKRTIRHDKGRHCEH